MKNQAQKQPNLDETIVNRISRETSQKPRFFEEFLGRTNCEKASVAKSCATRANLDNDTGALATATRSKEFKNLTSKIT
jgi:hypothetical protein